MSFIDTKSPISLVGISLMVIGGLFLLGGLTPVQLSTYLLPETEITDGSYTYSIYEVIQFDDGSRSVHLYYDVDSYSCPSGAGQPDCVYDNSGRIFSTRSSEYSWAERTSGKNIEFVEFIAVVCEHDNVHPDSLQLCENYSIAPDESVVWSVRRFDDSKNSPTISYVESYETTLKIEDVSNILSVTLFDFVRGDGPPNYPDCEGIECVDTTYLGVIVSSLGAAFSFIGSRGRTDVY